MSLAYDLLLLFHLIRRRTVDDCLIVEGQEAGCVVSERPIVGTARCMNCFDPAIIVVAAKKKTAAGDITVTRPACKRKRCRKIATSSVVSIARRSF